jgi:branched-chain amino acid transport system permease protein
VIRRFTHAPRLILTVATLGLAQAMAGLSLLLPSVLHDNFPTFFTAETAPSRFEPPFSFSFEIDPLVFSANDVIAVGGVVLTVIALALFLRYSRLGIAVRASAESGDRAMLLGVPVKRVQTTVWVIATVLAFLAMFLRAGVVGLPVGSVLGPSILIRALAAAVIGRMENFTVIFFAAVGLGILEQAVTWNATDGAMVAPILFAVVLLTLLVARRGPQTRTDEQSSWSSVSDVRGIPREFRHVPEVRWLVPALTVAGLLVALVLPLVVGESRTNLMGVILVFAMLAVSLVVLTGWAGQVSLGQVGFLGIGAAVGGAVSSRLGWDVLAAIGVAGVVGALVAVVLGLPALRVRGLMLAVITLAFAHAVSLWLLNQTVMSAWLPRGRIERKPLLGLIPIKSEAQYYYFTLACLVLILLMCKAVRHSRLGRTIIGVRENERGAQSYGINVVRAKLTAFALSGFIAAVAGAIFVHHQQALGINPYATEESLAVFTMVVIGGLGSLPGALLGAIYVQGARYFLPPELSFFVGGVGLLLVLMVLPGGLGSLLYMVRDGYLRWVAARRRLIVPSLNADVHDLASVNSGKEKGLELLRLLADRPGNGGAMLAVPGGPAPALSPDATPPATAVPEPPGTVPPGGPAGTAPANGQDHNAPEELAR